MSNFIGDNSAPPAGWQFETPRYRAVRDLNPAPKARFRFEPPFSLCYDSDSWQYGTQPVKAGEIIETKSWPHATFHALNYSAAMVLAFFNNRQKSRMQVSPWQGDRIQLDDGLGGTLLKEIARPRVAPSDWKEAS
jgi:hypothetical protein